MSLTAKLWNDESDATAIEYGLIAAGMPAAPAAGPHPSDPAINLMKSRRLTAFPKAQDHANRAV